MIRHCVFLRYNETVTEDDKSSIYGKLEALKLVCKGIMSINFGENISPEGLAKGFDDGFIIDFDTKDSLVSYIENSDHKAVGNELVSMLDGGLEGIVVFDLKA